MIRHRQTAVRQDVCAGLARTPCWQGELLIPGRRTNRIPARSARVDSYTENLERTISDA